MKIELSNNKVFFENQGLKKRNTSILVKRKSKR